MTQPFAGPELLNKLPLEILHDERVNKLNFEQFFRCLEKHCSSQLATNFIQLSKPSDRKPLRPVRHRSKKLTYRMRKRLGLYCLNRDGIQYSQLVGLNDMWKEYMRRLLNVDALKLSRYENCPSDSRFEQISIKLYRADYHGCEMFVVRSTCPSFVGISGIVAMETKNAFRLVGKDNICRTIPKETCQFEFFLDNFRFSLFGKNFIVRPADRSSKKIKSIKPPDL